MREKTVKIVRETGQTARLRKRDLFMGTCSHIYQFNIHNSISKESRSDILYLPRRRLSLSEHAMIGQITIARSKRIAMNQLMQT